MKNLISTEIGNHGQTVLAWLLQWRGKLSPIVLKLFCILYSTSVYISGSQSAAGTQSVTMNSCAFMGYFIFLRGTK